MANALMIIHPYRHEGVWVFDDEDAGLNREPFVAGADNVIDRAVQEKGIKDAEQGFRLLFSGGQFPDYDLKLDWLREADGGNWYRAEQYDMEGWLCPALFCYFDEAPKEIYARFMPGDT
tara:strand:+ start:153 stop:509 length:357 start_codon:yes stop_codon:yes gene_type:complete